MATANTFDVVVIGAGPGGYVAAIRAAQLGFSTACIDEWKNEKGGPAPGGTCTNVGCIPSKALLQSSENFEQAGHHFADHGIVLESLAIDVPKMMARKKTVVKQNNDGIVYLFKKNKIQFFHGRGSFVGKAEAGWQIAVAGAKAETLTARHVIVATGSSARPLPGVAFDEKTVLSNDGALAVERVPETLRDDVLAARSPADVDRAALKEAAAHADEGVRSVVDSLTSLRRLLGEQRQVPGSVG